MEEEEEEEQGWDKESDLQTTTLPPLIQLLLMALLAAAAAAATEPGDPEYCRLLLPMLLTPYFCIAVPLSGTPERVVVLQLTDGVVVVVPVDGATAGGMLSSSEGS